MESNREKSNIAKMANFQGYQKYFRILMVAIIFSLTVHILYIVQLQLQLTQEIQKLCVFKKIVDFSFKRHMRTLSTYFLRMTLEKSG